MKLLMILGGLVGFVIGITFGIAQESPWPSVIWRASIGAYVAGMLMRWWGRVWVRGLQAAHHERIASVNSNTGSHSKTIQTKL
jgi:hypothetical protein